PGPGAGRGAVRHRDGAAGAAAGSRLTLPGTGSAPPAGIVPTACRGRAIVDASRRRLLCSQAGGAMSPIRREDDHVELGATWEDLVERKIREAQERGDFDDLAGQGRPLRIDKNPYARDWELSMRG